MSQITDKKQGSISFIKEIFVLLLIVFIIRTFGFGLYQVPSGSMETTILVGERFFADKFTVLFSPPKRGDIIAFNEPATMYHYSSNPLKRLYQQYVWGPNNLTKRVIGVPGDIIKGVIEDGKPVIYRNGERLDEPYLNKYPIIRIWTEDLDKIMNKVQYESIIRGYGDPRGYINPSQQEEAVIHTCMNRYSAPRSFDPKVPFSGQKLYRIPEDRIVRKADGQPLEINYPGTPIHREEGYKPTIEGKSYWGQNADEFYVELGKTQYWCMGDNRLGSGDSRTFGPVEGSFIHGKIVFRIWSIDSDESWWILDLIKHPIDFWSRIRWNRFFQVVR